MSTSKVPCRFYALKACTKGQSCPFSHDKAAGSKAVCQYFLKGNCAYGDRCALKHVKP
ncbi:hypothetical protein BC831DRAFT_395764, partial [Entophlyctis helioformis]